ncbi:hypothetical protein GCM10017083_05420 [Thalassobaculum fulvum]|uniref:Aminoglycoside phosphotransferase domain-containing protein n=1 Tax=Thalassobaculum fulvum TaxID=1633335 RepID=A0A919CMN0_9PROT|nr:phosphotransferase [Thalassobaculum fulvum]GHD41240.1 hypothetical protein GCM10017083_05420 [Thalassobaculum fulvum]
MSPDPSASPGRPRPATTVDDDAIAALLAELGLPVRRLDFVAKASTSEVWRADTACGPIAVRIAAPRPGKPADFDAETALRRVLAAAGARVAAPMFDRRARPDLAVADHRPAWVVDRWIDGERADAATADAVWHELGVLLAMLHALPVRGHGRLRVEGDGVAGRLDDPGAAAADRFERPWPFDDLPLAGHPLAAAAPDLVPRLQRLEPAIRQAAAAPPAVVHGDLNGANVRHAGGALTGLIDFADATVLTPGWDFALLRHFQGGRIVDRVLAGYTRDPAVADRIARDARLRLGLAEIEAG